MAFPPVKLLSAFLLVALAGKCLSADLYAVLDGLRAGRGECREHVPQPRLVRVPALEQAAAAIAAGSELRPALESARYRATRAITIDLSGADVERQAAQMLEKDYCSQLAGADLREAGIHRAGDRILIVLAAPFSPAVTLTGDAFAARMLELVNQARGEGRDCGGQRFAPAGPVRWNDRLAAAATAHSEDMARHNSFTHEGHDGSTPAQRVLRAGYGYRATGENIAGGPASPEGAMATWIKSPAHCAILMNPVYSDMGAAYVIERNSDLGVYWTQVFGTPK
jgi:uncharacterized protein YkwD